MRLKIRKIAFGGAVDGLLCVECGPKEEEEKQEKSSARVESCFSLFHTTSCRPPFGRNGGHNKFYVPASELGLTTERSAARQVSALRARAAQELNSIAPSGALTGPGSVGWGVVFSNRGLRQSCVPATSRLLLCGRRQGRRQEAQVR